MREYIIALHISLPPNQTPENWLSKKLGSIDLDRIDVHIQEVKDESKTKSNTKTRSSGETKRNSEKT